MIRIRCRRGGLSNARRRRDVIKGKYYFLCHPWGGLFLPLPPPPPPTSYGVWVDYVLYITATDFACLVDLNDVGINCVNLCMLDC